MGRRAGFLALSKHQLKLNAGSRTEAGTYLILVNIWGAQRPSCTHRIVMGHKRKRKLLGRRVRCLDGIDGIDFVRCWICRDRYRVISGLHLSKHGIELETYMAEYDLSPDELIAKNFRLIQASHPAYHPYNQHDWIAAITKTYKRDGKVFAGYLQNTYPQLYSQGAWLFGDWDNALGAAGFDPKTARLSKS
jgi:hypothetical protein